MTTDAFDLRWGTDTAGTIALRDLSIDSPNAHLGQACQATHPEALPDAVRFIGIDANKFTFIDLGCGKGRMVLIASQLGFRKAIGVEFAPELVEIARSNVSKMNIHNASIISGDAANYLFPSGNLVVFLYNPFLSEVMVQVIGNLRKQFSAELYLIYRYPKCGEVIIRSVFLDYIGEVPGWEGPRGIHIWKAFK
jgi:SAM-dependent methyltransferase